MKSYRDPMFYIWILLPWLLLLLMVVAACGEQIPGPMGPQGPQGDQGPRGIPGSDGVSCEIAEVPDGIMIMCPNGDTFVPTCKCKKGGKK